MEYSVKCGNNLNNARSFFWYTDICAPRHVYGIQKTKKQVVSFFHSLSLRYQESSWAAGLINTNHKPSPTQGLLPPIPFGPVYKPWISPYGQDETRSYDFLHFMIFCFQIMSFFIAWHGSYNLAWNFDKVGNGLHRYSRQVQVSHVYNHNYYSISERWIAYHSTSMHDQY